MQGSDPQGEREVTTSQNCEEEGETSAIEDDGYAQNSSQFDYIAEKMRDEGLSEDKISILEMILDELAKEDLSKPFNLRNVERSMLKRMAREVSISEYNRLLIASANVVSQRLEIKREQERGWENHGGKEGSSRR